jgi:hypothetical protein
MPFIINQYASIVPVLIVVFFIAFQILSLSRNLTTQWLILHNSDFNTGYTFEEIDGEYVYHES